MKNCIIIDAGPGRLWVKCATLPGVCRRLGSAEMRATVTLEVDWRPQRHQCSPQLAAVVGMHAGTRPRILQVHRSALGKTPGFSSACTHVHACVPAETAVNRSHHVLA